MFFVFDFFRYYRDMQILTVAPITRGALQGSLTYFAKDPVEVGSLIMVPIRTREIPALVLEVRQVTEVKSSIKTSDYVIKKITKIKPRQAWNNAFLKAAEHTARFFVQGLGDTLLTLTPKIILNAYLDDILAEPALVEKPKKNAPLLAIQMSEFERIEEYRRLIRDSFVRHESTFVCLPTEADVMRVAGALKRGIEDYTFVFHSSLTKKRLLSGWQTCLEKRHAVVVIGTPQYLALPRYFDTIIIDEEHSRAWKTRVRPNIDQRIFVEEYAQNMGSALIFGSPILRPEIHKRIQAGEILEFGRVTARTYKELVTEIIDPRIEEKSIKEATGRRTVQILSKNIRELIETALQKKEHVVLLSARKGLSPITACGDCGTLVRCPACDTPLVMHRKEASSEIRQATRIFSCHACGFMRTPEEGEHETCKTCGGWRLEALGIGIERIDEEVSALFPDAKRYIFDGSHVKTSTQAHKLLEQFEKTEGGILITTPMSLPYLTATEYTAIISIDSLFAIPDFRMNERIFALILALREKTQKKLLIQTRTDDDTLIRQALDGTLSTFIAEELSLRKAFSYPPYGTIIKITLRGKKEGLAEEMNRFKHFLSNYNLIVPPSMSREPFSIKNNPTKNIFCMHAILKLAEDDWIDATLLTKLRALPPQFCIEVNPDHLL